MHQIRADRDRLEERLAAATRTTGSGTTPSEAPPVSSLDGMASAAARAEAQQAEIDRLDKALRAANRRMDDREKECAEASGKATEYVTLGTLCYT